ncbi:hypothetical protein SAMN04488069_102475 [Hymenobacter psychrophilus]|uniref:Uncharacterized protein n=1 Tax=Hymenobacter psychrophilus TaxID=651662 RepID=A0A1H3DS33_9BACT|nr:hypothetical protein SAMN04488069_102475 [Hymenobacter psychrophilus]
MHGTNRTNTTWPISYQTMGQVVIGGKFSGYCNTLEFEFPSDQSFIRSTLAQLQRIVSKYGDMKGIGPS